MTALVRHRWCWLLCLLLATACLGDLKDRAALERELDAGASIDARTWSISHCDGVATKRRDAR